MPGYIAKPPICVLQRGHPLAQGLVGAWPFDVGGGGKHVRDLSGRGNHGTAQAFDKWVGGAFGWCMDFDGTSDYVTVPSSTSLDPGNDDWTVAVWFNTSVSTGSVHSRSIIERYAANLSPVTNGSWGIGILGSGYSDPSLADHIRYTFRDDADNLIKIVSANAMNDGVWHHAVGVRTATKGSFYIDGALEGEDAIATGTTTFNDNVYIGATAGYETGTVETSRLFDGRIDDVRVYRRALSAEEIAAIYHDPWEIYRPREMTLRAQYVVAALYRMLRRRAR